MVAASRTLLRLTYLHKILKCINYLAKFKCWCLTFMDYKAFLRFGTNCMFAHGNDELRQKEPSHSSGSASGSG